MNFKRPKIWACSRLLASSFLGLFCAGGFLNLNMTMMVAHAEGHVFDGNCINRTNYDPQTEILTIPPGYTEIKNLGNRKDIKTVNIPASITKIGGAAFMNCSSLTNVNIEPNSELKEINCEAFRECTALEKINLPEGLKEIGESAFYDCTSLTDTSIPSNVNTIGPFAFGYCTSLREIFLPRQIEVIGTGTFADCSSLENIDIPDGVTWIGTWAFSGCTSLKTIALPKELQEIGKSAFARCRSIIDISMPDAVSKMGESVFIGCTSLKTVRLSAGLQEIPEHAFAKCSSLENINIPDGVGMIGLSAFSECTSLKSIILPKKLREIDAVAFWGCSSIKNIVMPDTVSKMGRSVFGYCTSLETVHLSDDLQEIPKDAFAKCSSLKNVSVRNKVRKIGTGAFSECHSIEMLHFPHSLEEVEYDAFKNCKSLKVIKIPGQTKIMSPCGEEIDAHIIGRGTKIERFACDSQHNKCDSSPNLSKGEEPSPRSFGGGFLGSMGLVQMGMMADVTNRLLKNQENMSLPSSPIPDSDNPFFEKTSKFKNPAVEELEETVREEQPYRSTGKLSLMTMGWGLAVGAMMVAGHNMILDPNILYNHGSGATDPYAFLDGYHFVLRYGIYCLEKIDKGEFH